MSTNELSRTRELCRAPRGGPDVWISCRLTKGHAGMHAWWTSVKNSRRFGRRYEWLEPKAQVAS